MSNTLSASAVALEPSTDTPQSVMIKPPPVKRARSGPMADRVFGWVAKGAALFTLAMLIAILVSLTISAWPAIQNFGIGFLFSTPGTLSRRTLAGW